MFDQCFMPREKNSSRDLFPGALEMMMLESLRRQPAHGYALVQHIQQRSNQLLQVEEGSLYPALQRLLKAKLVKAEWTISPSFASCEGCFVSMGSRSGFGPRWLLEQHIRLNQCEIKRHLVCFVTARQPSFEAVVETTSYGL
jgi:hypothetical protein